MDHWLAANEPDEMLLFHYTGGDKLGKILETGQFRMSPYTSTNDPRETKEWVVEVIMAAADASADAKREVNNARTAADRILRRGARLACFTLDRAAASDAEPGSLFHRGWARARMWSQYADRHAGACLVFQRELLVEQVDVQRPHAEGDLFSFGRVSYVDRSLRIPMPMADGVTQSILDVLDGYQIRRGVAGELYFNKNSDWASEQEFRVVVVRWNLPVPELDDPLDVPFDPSLRAVVVGDAFPAKSVTELRTELASRPDVDLLRCSWTGGAPLLELLG